MKLCKMAFYKRNIKILPYYSRFLWYSIDTDRNFEISCLNVMNIIFESSIINRKGFKVKQDWKYFSVHDREIWLKRPKINSDLLIKPRFALTTLAPPICCGQKWKLTKMNRRRTTTFKLLGPRLRLAVKKRLSKIVPKNWRKIDHQNR